MKREIPIIFSFLLCYSLIYGQNTDTVQPDSLYHKYNIRFRSSYYEGSSSKSKEIFVFDRSGRYAGFILTDNETGKVPQLTMTFQYNNTGVLSAENDTSFRGKKYAIKKAELFYGPSGELVKKIMKNNGNLISEISYTPSENKETEILYRNGKVYREQTSYYDKQHKKIRFTGTEPIDKDAKPKVIELNGKKYTFTPKVEDQNWDYIFENNYDKVGNLITQKRFVGGKLQDETDFVYDDNGLLKEQKESNHSQVIKFEYAYY